MQVAVPPVNQIGEQKGDISRKGLLSPGRRLLGLSVICACIFLVSATGASVSGPLAAVCLPLPLLVAAYCGRDRLLPRFSSYTHVKLLTLVLLYVSSAFYWLPQTILSTSVISVLSDIAQTLHMPPLPDPLAFNVMLSLLVLGVVLAVNLLWHQREVIHATADPALEGILSRRDFQATLQRYCSALVAELDRYDRDVNWSDRELTPLEAEVEAERGGHVRPRIVSDLVKAIRRDRTSTVFLILGDPGSGKSVSLRRLVRVLCQQASQTGVVPVYVNLREYPPNEEPTTEALVNFVREMAFRQTGRDGRAFLDTCYEPFRRSGRLFFVIDSFDELPAVLDCDEKSDSHKRISATFDRFFTQEIQTCHGVLASRHYRAPVNVKGTRLIIRPFSEGQIRSAMRTWLLGKGINTDRYIRRLFRERPHLVPLLRNPFTAELIAEYALSGTSEGLPDSLYTVFNHYLAKRLNDDLAELTRLKLSATEVRESAGIIARKMYESADF